LSSHHQYICLSDDNEVTLPDPASGREDLDCHLMTPEDLRPSARAQLDGLPADSYDEVRGQITRLAQEALPVCLTLSPGEAEGEPDAEGTDGAEGAEGRGPGAEGAAGPEEATTERDGSTGARPGENCREVTS